MNRLCGVCLVLITVAGCGLHTVPAPAEVGRTEHHRLVRLTAETDFSSLAAEMLGDEAFASTIARANGLQLHDRLIAGDLVVVPLKRVNSALVSAAGVQQVQILCYHRFSEQLSSDPMVTSRADFEAQMNYLADQHYQVISLREFDARKAGGGVFAERTVIITIDDGYASAAAIALPVLERFAFPATLFVYPDFIGGGHALSWAELRAIHGKRLFDVQSHATSHTSLLPAPAEEKDAYLERVDMEVRTADRTIKQRVGAKPVYFAFPYGDVSREVLASLRRHGYRLALTVQRGGSALFDEPYLLRRTMIYGQDDLSAFAQKLETHRPLANR